MDRKLFGFLSGWQFTVLALGAMLVPGALYAIPSFTNVAIEDAGLGYRASVDSGHHLYVYDQVANYKNNPANLVNILVVHSGMNQCETSQIYNVPNGKALILTTVTGNTYAISAGTTGYFMSSTSNCSGTTLSNYFLTSAASTSTPLSVNFGAGLLVKPGASLSLYSDNNGGFTFIQGYLIPASAVPAADEATNQPRAVNAADVIARMNARR